MKRVLLVILVLFLLLACGKSETLSEKIESFEYGQFEVDMERDGNVFKLLLIEDDVMYYTYIPKVSLGDFDEDQSYNAKIYSIDVEGSEKVVVDNIGYASVFDLVRLEKTLYFLTYYSTMDTKMDEIYSIVNIYKKEIDSDQELIQESNSMWFTTLPRLYKFKDAVYGLIQDIAFALDGINSYIKHDFLYNYSEKELVYDIDKSKVTIAKEKEGPIMDEEKDFSNQVHFASLVDVGDKYLTFSTLRYKGNNEFASELYLFDDNNDYIIQLDNEIIENPIVIGDNIIYLTRDNQETHNRLKIINKDDPLVFKKFNTQYQIFNKVYQDDDTVIVFTEGILGRQSFKALSIEEDLEINFTEVSLFNYYEGSPFLIDNKNNAKTIYLDDKIVIQYIK